MHHFRYHLLGEAFPDGCVDVSIGAKRTPYGFFTAELCRDVLNFCWHLSSMLAPTVAPFKWRQSAGHRVFTSVAGALPSQDL